MSLEEARRVGQRLPDDLKLTALTFPSLAFVEGSVETNALLLDWMAAQLKMTPAEKNRVTFGVKGARRVMIETIGQLRGANIEGLRDTVKELQGIIRLPPAES